MADPLDTFDQQREQERAERIAETVKALKKDRAGAGAEPQAGPCTPENCFYLAGCRWPSGCGAEDICIGQEVEGSLR